MNNKVNAMPKLYARNELSTPTQTGIGESLVPIDRYMICIVMRM